ncbi:MAG: alpha/beta hydrolase family protein, partial [Planctomycetota bacterium]
QEVTCYAESSDGVHIIKPKLDLFAIKGSKSNNVILAGAAPVHHNFSPFLDARPGVPAGERFKALGGTQKSGLIAYVSADGVRWKRLREEPVFTKGLFDSQNVSFWSEAEQCYLCYFRTWTGTGYGGFRSVSRTASKDFLSWTEPVEMSFGNTPREHIYTNQTHSYFRAPHIYISVAARFLPGRQVLSAEEAKRVNVNPNYFKDCSDAVLMTSRGDNVYNRTFMEGFIRPGVGLQNWVSRSNYPALNVVQTGPDEMSLYVQHDYAQPTAHLRRYSLRLDGFVSLNAPYKGGSMTTKPLVFTGNQLVLNFATSAPGFVRVEIQDTEGKPIPGYSLDESRELIGNYIEHPASWKHGTDVSALAGRPVRLRFVMKDADLYSLKFRSDHSNGSDYDFPEAAELPVQKGLPDLFRMYDGSRVSTPDDWREQRDYLKKMLAHYLYGHMPPRPKRIEVDKVSAADILDGNAIEEHYKLTTSRNGKSLSFRMALVRPAGNDRRPVIVKNCSVLFDPNALPEGHKSRATAQRDRNAARMTVKRGYILCKFVRTDVAADSKDNRSSGVFVLYPEYDWGTIAAWAWAHQLVVDALDKLGYADMERIIATGHSRGGKTALCAGIYDERVAITAPNSSGTGGTGSLRYFEPGQRPQTVSYLVKAFPHWFAGRFAEFADQPERLPFDSHFMKALIAPRGLVNCHARQDYWANPYGTELTYRAAQVVFDRLGAGDHQGIHWRQGGHAQNEEDWQALLDFADKYFFGKKVDRKFDALAYPDAEVPMP